ncbi:MAG: ArsR family transcriptional regulator [Caldisphaera sp.]|jgi:DNA-binding transcriptional ArsR family regulator|uniref:ArsR family transcriptional regulator n=1 Tax=Caldisphaera sp. TaxID=2060322 RepID=UPI0025BD65E2|nr:ArsR family transcriptional regulator [Caldisphaera sp.]
MDIEKVLASKGKVRILKVLMKEGQVNISRLVKLTGLHHDVIVKNMEELKEMGIVEEKRYGRLRIYMIDLRDPKISGLYEIFKEIENL